MNSDFWDTYICWQVNEIISMRRFTKAFDYITKMAYSSSPFNDMYMYMYSRCRTPNWVMNLNIYQTVAFAKVWSMYPTDKNISHRHTAYAP